MIDWGLLDEFTVYATHEQDVQLYHEHCQRQVGDRDYKASVADLVLAVEEHMKECGK